MTKPLSELITNKTKTEDLFDLLKGGFSVDVKSIPIIQDLAIRQMASNEGRAIPDIKKYKESSQIRADYSSDGKRFLILYPYDDSVYESVIRSYISSKLSETSKYAVLNNLFKELSIAHIKLNLSGLNNSVIDARGLVIDDALIPKTLPEYKNFSLELEKLEAVEETFEKRIRNEEYFVEWRLNALNIEKDFIRQLNMPLRRFEIEYLNYPTYMKKIAIEMINDVGKLDDYLKFRRRLKSKRYNYFRILEWNFAHIFSQGHNRIPTEKI